jgi:hypothetical protein
VDIATVGQRSRACSSTPSTACSDDTTGAFNNPNYSAAAIGRRPERRRHGSSPNSPLEHLYHEQISFTCGDCHLGSAGQNNRAGDFRSSGCSACPHAYSLGGAAAAPTRT